MGDCQVGYNVSIIDSTVGIREGINIGMKKYLDPNSKLPAGWYIALPTKKLNQTPVALTLFAQSLIAWRGKKGQAVVSEQYCPHMGASLVQSKVKAGCLECPFHRWIWEDNGVCSHIPGQNYIPQTAKLITFPTQEKYGYVWVWYGTPQPLYPLPLFAPAEENKKHYLTLRFKFNAPTTTRRVLENAYDNRHFIDVHGLPADDTTLELKAPGSLLDPEEKYLPGNAQFGGVMSAKIARFVGVAGWIAQKLGVNAHKFELFIKSFPTGHIIDLHLDGKERFSSLVSVSPQSDTITHQHVLFMVKKAGNPLQNLGCYLLFGIQTMLSGWQDVPIWKKMQPEIHRVAVKNDSGVLQYRKFYQSWAEKCESLELLKPAN
jgi:nitrite reductase/ring-hydroxylating ferredoxin subunit